VLWGIGMAVFCAVSSTAHAQGITVVAGGPFQNAPFAARSSQFTEIRSKMVQRCSW
jgi:hypothetical protein